MNYSELYKTGNSYTVHGLSCLVKEVRYSKSGRISAKIINDKWGEFWTSSRKPETVVDLVHANKMSEDTIEAFTSAYCVQCDELINKGL